MKQQHQEHCAGVQTRAQTVVEADVGDIHAFDSYGPASCITVEGHAPLPTRKLGGVSFIIKPRRTLTRLDRCTVLVQC